MKGLLTIQFKNGPDMGGIKREFTVIDFTVGVGLLVVVNTQNITIGFNLGLIAWYEFTPAAQQGTLEGVKG